MNVSLTFNRKRLKSLKEYLIYQFKYGFLNLFKSSASQVLLISKDKEDSLRKANGNTELFWSDISSSLMEEILTKNGTATLNLKLEQYINFDDKVRANLVGKTLHLYLGQEFFHVLRNRHSNPGDFNSLNLLFKNCFGSKDSCVNKSLLIGISPDDIYWVDDALLFLSKVYQGNLIFYPTRQLLDNFIGKADAIDSSRFHLGLFFENLYRQKDLTLPLRFYYKELTSVLSHKTGDMNALKNRIDLAFKMRIGKDDSVYNKNSFPDVWGYSLVESILQPKLDNFFKHLFVSVKQVYSGKNNHKIDFENIGTQQSVARQVNPTQWNKVLISGWYGTETQGDKAILGEVLHFIRSASPKCEIILTTLHQQISLQTNSELADLHNVTLVDINSANNRELISSLDAVIIGGGPLMESASMYQLGVLFNLGYKEQKDLIIFGCGIGPIHTKEVEIITRYMLSVCTAGFVRDKESLEYANRLYPGHVLKFACDPAVGFISRWRKENNFKYNPASHKISTLLRANTGEFAPGASNGELDNANLTLAQKAASAINLIGKSAHTEILFLHMNAPWVGGDDRIFNRQIIDFLDKDLNYHLVREYFTLNEQIDELSKSSAALAMRYHGHIFCMALGIPFISLDYTGKKGKVSSLVSRIDYSDWSVVWSDIEPDHLNAKLSELRANSSYWSEHLITQANKLVSLLHETYTEVFNYCPKN